jgi:hypothetical protein
MDRFVELVVERRLLGVKSRLGKFKLMKDNPVVNAVHEVILFIQLIRETVVTSQNQKGWY